MTATSSFKTAVVLVAAGRGTRAARDGDVTPKQYRPLRGRPLLAFTTEALLQRDAIDLVQPVIGPGDVDRYNALGLQDAKLLAPVTGGATRQLSVLAGLQALEGHNPDYVLIHDAARPFVGADVVNGVIGGLAESEAVLPVTAVIDTIKRSEDGRTVGGTEDRTQLYAAQTPQGFHFNAILAAHRRAAELSDSFTDDAAIAEWAHMPVALSKGSYDNIKITTADDFRRAELMLEAIKPMETRMGSGYDIHRFVPGDAVTLGGIRIPHTHRLAGHSDADAALHVLTDALLGALAEGDIGTHFPPSEVRWKDEPSATFLQFAVARVRKRGGRIVHLDLTLMCEAPKIGPYAHRIRRNIAGICAITEDRVSVKATTSEKMGFVGRGEGLAAMGAATIELPRSVE